MSCVPNASHPDLAKLRSFLCGKLTAVERSKIKRHIEVCGLCYDKLQNLTDREVKKALPVPPVRENGAGPASGRNGAPLPLPSEWPTFPGYKILGELGKGGMGLVFRALHVPLNRHVALKVIRDDAGPRARARFRNEAEVMARLQHPNIVPIFEVGEHLGRPFFAMECLAGGSLSKLVGDVPQEPKAAARLVEGLARAMHYAHQRGVIHRDLKPSNILLTDPAQPPGATNGVITSSFLPDLADVKITDFGIAKILNTEEIRTHLTLPDQALGTPSYMSPEQAGGKVGEIGTFTDVYALGAILYKMLTGHAPYEGGTDLVIVAKVRSEDDFPLHPSHWRPDVPKDLESICLKCLEKEPARRYSSAEQLEGELRRFRQGEPLQHTRPVGRLERLRRWCRRKPALATAACLAAVLLVAAIAGPVAFTVQAYCHSQDLKRQLAENYLDKALTLLEQDNSGAGMLWLARSLRIAPEGADDLRQVIRINLAGWSRRISVMSYPPLACPDEIAAASPGADGKTLFTGGRDGALRQWDLATGQELPRWPGQLRSIQALAVSPDGKAVLTGDADGTARLWELTTGRELRQFRHQKGSVTAVAFSPDGKTVLTGGSDCAARLWDLTTGRELRQFSEHQNVVKAVAFSPDGKAVLTGSQDQKALLWSIDSPEPIREFKHQLDVVAASFGPDGRTIVTGTLDETAHLWDGATGQPLGSCLRKQGVIKAITCGPDGNGFLTVSADKTARLWHVPTPLGRSLGDHGGAVWAVTVSPDGKMVLTASGDLHEPWAGKAWLRYFDTGMPVGPAFLHERWIRTVAFSPDGKTALTASWDKTAKIWDATSGKLLHVLRGHDSQLTTAFFSPDGKMVLTASNDGAAQVWETATGRKGARLSGHEGPVTAAAFGPGGRIVTGDAAGVLRLWKAASEKQLALQKGHAARVNVVVFRPTGLAFFTGSEDRTARLWEVADNGELKERANCEGHHGPILALALSPDGHTVLTGSADGTARLWDAATGQALGPDLLHQKDVLAVAFSPDGHTVLTGSADGTARLWDVGTRRALGPPLRHAGRVFAAAFAPDGQWVVTGSGDGTARVWAKPNPLEGGAERIALWAQVITGKALNERGAVRELGTADSVQLRQRLASWREPPLPAD